MSLPVAQVRRAQRGVSVQRFLAGDRRRAAALGDGLGPQERARVVATFVELLEGLYAHLPLKRAMYGVDPVQRLRLLGQRVDLVDPVTFGYELAGIVTGLRDAHTRYVGPPLYDGCVAMLPFLVEAYGPPNAPHYIVSKTVQDPAGRPASSGPFRAGVEVLTWNAVPMDIAVNRHADAETGGRPDSRRARALESMTLRALQFGPPPDELWVDIGFADRAGRRHTHRVEWRVVQPRASGSPGATEPGADGRRHAIDPAAEVHRQAKKLLFKPDVWWQGVTAAVPRAGGDEVPDGQWLPTTMPDVLAARVVTVDRHRLGYLRLWSFDVADDDAYLAEVTRLLALLPERGLVIDLRANPGGLIWAAERLLQLFTPNPVSPNGFSLVATALTRDLAGAPQNAADFEPWLASLTEAVATGEPYSSAVPITPVERCNDLGQVYGGPVVAVVDPNTYSAGDLFAAGFVDSGVGRLVCVGEASGGGGANVWTAAAVGSALLGTAHATPDLPAGLSYTLAVRRATRSGPAVGAAIEDVGVRGQERHAMTYRDLTESNRDLVDHAAKVVLSQRWSSMTVLAPDGDGHPLVVRTRGVEWLDVLVDDAYLPSLKVTGRTTRVPVSPSWGRIEVRGRASGELVQRRVLRSG